MKAYDFIDEPKKWCQGTYTRDINGEPCVSYSKDAVSFCVIGAISRVYSEDHHVFKIVKLLERRVGHVAQWNDAPERTWQEVHAVLKELDI